MNLMAESIIGIVSLIGGFISFVIIIVNLVRKKKVAKPIIFFMIFFVMFIVAVNTGNKLVSETKRNVDTKENNLEEANLELKRGNLEEYTKDVKEPLDSYFDGYDALLGQWEKIFNALGDGQITSLDAYSSIKKLNDGFYDLWKMIDDLETPSYFSNEDKENLKNAKTNLSMAVVQWQQATKKAMKMLDKNEFSNSKMSEIKELTSKSQEYLVPAVSSKVLLDSSYGIELEQQ